MEFSVLILELLQCCCLSRSRSHNCLQNIGNRQVQEGHKELDLSCSLKLTVEKTDILPAWLNGSYSTVIGTEGETKVCCKHRFSCHCLNIFLSSHSSIYIREGVEEKLTHSGQKICYKLLASINGKGNQRVQTHFQPGKRVLQMIFLDSMKITNFLNPEICYFIVASDLYIRSQNDAVINLLKEQRELLLSLTHVGYKKYCFGVKF